MSNTYLRNNFSGLKEDRPIELSTSKNQDGEQIADPWLSFALGLWIHSNSYDPDGVPGIWHGNMTELYE